MTIFVAKTDLKELTKLRLKSKFFKALSDPARLAILQTLRDGEQTVSDIIDSTDYSQSNISNHLVCLKECGLLGHRKEGKFVYYFIQDKQILKLFDQADEIIARSIQQLHNCLL